MQMPASTHVLHILGNPEEAPGVEAALLLHLPPPTALRTATTCMPALAVTATVTATVGISALMAAAMTTVLIISARFTCAPTAVGLPAGLARLAVSLSHHLVCTAVATTGGGGGPTAYVC